LYVLSVDAIPRLLCIPIFRQIPDCAFLILFREHSVLQRTYMTRSLFRLALCLNKPFVPHVSLWCCSAVLYPSSILRKQNGLPESFCKVGIPWSAYDALLANLVAGQVPVISLRKGGNDPVRGIRYDVRASPR